MATTYVDDEHIFTFKAEGPVLFGSFSLRLSTRGSGFSYTEADINSAIQAFADSLNASGHEHIDKVEKIITAAGVSDWDYEPA
ncbi:hypothetical protein ACFWR9_42065 [Streptomyces sp. NPDC058534]|uniref:hypothetical protein n=1 Tax=Streptomyces sp. NPDC058534 TaxID=3346541 RepID=UPI003668CCDA